MDDKKFDAMMKTWTEHEHESALQLRPTKDMYQMVKAKKPNVWFPVFARWVTVGVAAMIIVVAAFLHPGLVPLPPFQDKTSKQETAPTEPKGEFRDEDVAGPDVPSTTEEKKDAFTSRERTYQEPGIPTDTTVEKASAGEGIRREQNVVADKMPEKAVISEEMEVEHLEQQVAANLEIESAPEDAMQPQPQEEMKVSTAVSMLKSRSVAETRKAKEEPSPEKGPSQITTPTLETEKEETPEPSAMRALSVGRTSLPEKHIGEKIFHFKENVWIDAAYTPEQKLLTIKRDSQAYRDLLTALPDLQEYVDVGERVIVVVGDNALEIATEGETELTEEELEKLSEP